MLYNVIACTIFEPIQVQNFDLYLLFIKFALSLHSISLAYGMLLCYLMTVVYIVTFTGLLSHVDLLLITHTVGAL
jgi:hypothetical protein